MEKNKPLSNLQIELLKVFKYDLSEEQLKEVQQMLAKYFAEKMSDEMDKLFDERNWGEEKIAEWSKEHMRTKYN